VSWLPVWLEHENESLRAFVVEDPVGGPHLCPLALMHFDPLR